MAINFLNSVNLNQNLLIKARIENQPNNAAAGTGVEGQLYYDTTLDAIKVWSNGAWVLTTNGFVPYTGATSNVNLGSNSLTANAIIKAGGTSTEFLKADGSVDSNAYIVLASLSASSPLSYNNTTGAFSIQVANGSQNGYLSSTDWTTFNSKQGTITLTTTGTSGVATLASGVLNIPNYTINTNEFVHIVGDEFIYNTKKFYQTNSIVSQLEFNNTRSIDGLSSIEMVNTAGASSIDIVNSGVGEGINILNSSEGYGQIITNDGIGYGLLVSNNGAGSGGIGGGIKIIGSSYAPSFTISNSAQGDAIFINSVGASAGTPINLQQDSVTNFQVSKLGDVTANKLIKSGGTSVQYLMADGSVSTGPSLTGYVPYTGATQDVDLGEHGITLGQVTLDITPTGTAIVGTTQWNNTIGSSQTTLKGGTVLLKNGVDLVARVVNKVTPNATLLRSNYAAVRVSGAQGQRLAVAYAQANNDNNSADTIGLICENIATNQEGFIITVGQLLEINTTGSLQGETWVDGDVLYLSPTTPGALTNVKPTGLTGHIVVIGYVEYAHAVHGSIYVKIMNGWELDELHNVYINSATLANNQVLTYDSSVSLWENKSLGTIFGGTGSQLVAGNGTLISAGTGISISGGTISSSIGTVTNVSALTLGTGGTDLSSTVANSTTTPVITLNVPTASATNRGVLSSTDWTTFNNKQAAGNYITSLTGEATASGPGSAAVTLSTPAVTGKLLTGVNITGGTVLATDSMLTAFGKLQNQINSLIGGSIYQGVWNANTNSPTLTSSVGTDGNYYIVNVAGSTNLNGITDWKVGDWAIFHGGTWQKVDNTESVSSVNGQTGAVSLTTDNISEGSTNLYFTNSRARAALSFTAGSGAYNSTTGVITIPTNTSQLTNGANFIALASLSGTAPIQYNNTTGAISITQSGNAGDGYLSSTDWNTFNSKQAALNGTGFVKISGTTISYDSNTYALDSSVVKLTGDQNIAGVKTFTNGSTTWDKASGGSVLYFQQSGVQNANLNFNSTYSQFTSFATDGFLFNGNIGGVPSNLLILKQDGKLGIGTTSPSYKLDVNGDISLSNGYYYKVGSINLVNDTQYIPKATTLGYFVNSLLYDNGTNVGIGTTSPAYKLDINGDMRLLNSATSIEKIYFSNGPQIEANGPAGYFKSGNVYTNTTSANVGIGTTSPVAKLQIQDTNGGIFFDGSGATYNRFKSTTSSASVGRDLLFSTQNSGTTPDLYITSGGNIGIGTSNPALSNLVISPIIGTGTVDGLTVIYHPDGGSNRLRAKLWINDFNGQLDLKDNGDTQTVKVSSNGNSYFNGGNVGIGTTSPSGKLDVFSTGDVYQNIVTSGNSTSSVLSMYNSSGVTDGAAIGYNGAMRFGTITGVNAAGFTERMRITSAGNVGIGTTSPSFGFGSGLHVKGNSGWGEIKVEGQSFSGGNGSGISFYSEATALADIYSDTNKNLIFRNNGTVERMRITSGGNVGIGTTSPVTALSFADTAGTAGEVSKISLFSTSGSGLYGFGVSPNQLDYVSGGSHVFYNRASGVSTERMRITSAGNVGIGTNNPLYALDIYNTGASTARVRVTGTSNFALLQAQNDSGAFYLGVDSSTGDGFAQGNYTRVIYSSNDYPLAISVNNTERMRITSAGNVLIGTTTYGSIGVSFDKLGASIYNYNGTGSWVFEEFKNNNGTIGSISTNGTVTAYNVTSDYRLKQDFKPFNGLDLVSKIKVYDYEWKIDNSRMNGVIAHELQEVVPYAVTGEKDAEAMQQVDYSKLVPILVQAIQELKQEIEILKNK